MNHSSEPLLLPLDRAGRDCSNAAPFDHPASPFSYFVVCHPNILVIKELGNYKDQIWFAHKTLSSMRDVYNISFPLSQPQALEAQKPKLGSSFLK